MNNINAIKFLSEGASIISLATVRAKSCKQIDCNISLEYSYNGIDWNEWDLSALTVNSGDTLYIRGYNPSGFSYNPLAYYTFRIEGGKVSCSGNIMSLIDYKTLPDVIPCKYCFYGLFEGCTSLTTAPELPAKTLADYCYAFMFYGCNSLTFAPKLPAKILINYCYRKMFAYCTALTAKPELPAILPPNWYYFRMFDGCTLLKDKK